MKKSLLSVICLLAMSATYLQASGGISFSQYKDINSYGVSISTVQFSTLPVQAFLGTGIVYGVRSTTASLLGYFDVYDTTSIPLTPAWTDPGFKFRISLTTASPSVDPYEKPLSFPVRFQKGCWWQHSNSAANSAGLYYNEIQP